ncbi:putative baseplate wedge tail fiber connector [Escherichia phage vB_EcoM_G2248]|nr:putative baseplate wedge tail fiber connector [Escherichia phage vB_EcoM_G2248]
MAQVPKKRIDTGTVGNPSTGDILYDGGNKINDNFDSIYDAFADQRLKEIDHGAGRMVIHATGYYQKHPRQSYAGSAVEIGSLHDIDTTQGALIAILPKAKVGEGVVFINSNGSFSATTPLNIRTQAGDSISGYSGDAVITQPFSKVTVWCTAVEGSRVTWRLGIESMFADTTTPLDRTVNVTGVATNVAIAAKTEYVSIKLLTTASNTTGSKMRSSETLLMIDARAGKVYATEYAVLQKTEDELYTVRYFIGSGDKVYAEYKATGENIRLAVKATDTIKIGVAT